MLCPSTHQGWAQRHPWDTLQSRGTSPRSSHPSQGCWGGRWMPICSQHAGYPGLLVPQTRGTGGIEGCEKCVATETDAEPLTRTPAQGTLGEMWCPRRLPWAGRMLPIGLHRHHQLHGDVVLPLPGARVRRHVCDGRTVTAARRGVQPRWCLTCEGARLALSILDKLLGLPDLRNLPACCRHCWQGHPLVQPLAPESPE